MEKYHRHHRQKPKIPILPFAQSDYRYIDLLQMN